MLFVSFPSQGGLWPLVFVGFVPAVVAQYRLLPRKISGVALGIVFWGYWTAALLNFASVGGAPEMIILGFVAGLVGCLIGIFERPFAERTHYRWFIVQLPIIWVSIDILTQGNLLFGGLNWIAYRLAPIPSMIQPVSILSTPALSFLLVMINAALALGIIRLMDKRRPSADVSPVPPSVVRWSGAIVGVIVLLWIPTSLLIRYSTAAASGPKIRVAGVQIGLTNAAHGTALVPGNENELTPAEDHARVHAEQIQLSDMTKQAAKQGAQLVIWPEEALESDLRKPELGKWIGDLAHQTNTYVVAGFLADPPKRTSPNMTALYAPDGSLVGTYYKVHPVVEEGEAFKTPSIYQTFWTKLGPIGMIICFDHDFTSSPRMEALTGAKLIAVPAVDFSSVSQLRPQSLAFRAVENHVSMAKLDLAWDSVFVSPTGDVVAKSVNNKVGGDEALIIGDLPLGPRNAPLMILGPEVFGALVLLALVGRIVLQIRSRRRPRAEAVEAGPQPADAVAPGSVASR